MKSRKCYLGFNYYFLVKKFFPCHRGKNKNRSPIEKRFNQRIHLNSVSPGVVWLMVMTTYQLLKRIPTL